MIEQVPSGLPLDAAGLDKRRLGFLKLIDAAEDFKAQEVALVALAASCCPDEQVRYPRRSISTPSHSSLHMHRLPDTVTQVF